MQYQLVHLGHKIVATVWIFASLSASISGIALYACIAIHHNHAATNTHRCMALPHANNIPTNAGTIYNTLKMPSKKGIAFALIGFAE